MGGLDGFITPHETLSLAAAKVVFISPDPHRHSKCESASKIYKEAKLVQFRPR
mgnify:CR=1 FL=1